MSILNIYFKEINIGFPIGFSSENKLSIIIFNKCLVFNIFVINVQTFGNSFSLEN